jgi:hypothetical protein
MYHAQVGAGVALCVAVRVLEGGPGVLVPVGVRVSVRVATGGVSVAVGVPCAGAARDPPLPAPGAALIRSSNPRLQSQRIYRISHLLLP